MTSEITEWNDRCKYLKNVYWLEKGTTDFYNQLIEDVDYACYDTENSSPNMKIDRIIKAFDKNGYQITRR